VRFGISILQSSESLADVGRLAKLAEDSGFDLVGIPDSHSILREVYVAMAVAGAATSKALIGPMVTNISTRHYSVTASGMASIDELTGGRAFLGIATGNSAVANVDLPRATLADLERAVHRIRAALVERTAEVGLVWGDPHAIPVYIAAAGPKTVAAAARCADVIVLDMGKDPHIIGKAVDLAREEHARSPRAQEPLEIWVLGKGFVADDPAEARNACATIMAATANDAFRVSFGWKEVPEDLHQPLREFADRYAFSQHASTSRAITENVELMYELGLAEFIYDRFALTGSGAQVTEMIRKLEAVGVDGISFTGAVQDKPTFIRRLGETVLPNFSATAAL
jgi:5,10-methylenetetrahydromethanopterin reductase